jgi:hypothetical protein
MLCFPTCLATRRSFHLNHIQYLLICLITNMARFDYLFIFWLQPTFWIKIIKS